MAGENDSAILSTGLRLYRAIYARCREIAHAEVIGYLGQIIRGGRVQWPYQLPGHGYELTQHDTYTFTTTDIPANADTSNVVTIDYPIGYDTSGAAPDVYASSQDSDWTATATPNGSNPHTQLDLFAARRAPLTTPQTGSASPTMLAGHSSVVYSGNPILFPVAYDPASTPVPIILFQTTDPDFVAQATSPTPTGFDLTVYYRPNMASGGLSTDPTGLTVTAMQPISPATDVLAAASASTGSAGSTANNSDGTDTGASSRSPNTGDQSQDHTHLEHDAGGQTDGESVGHHHQMDHTHPHNASGGTHTHPVGAHTHPVDDHHHSKTDPGHTHTFGGTATDVSADTPITVVWQSFGTRAAPAATVDVSWLAIGQQALPA